MINVLSSQRADVRAAIGTILSFVLLSLGADTTITVDLSQIGHIAPKGRVQDEEYNPHNRVVSALIAAGPDAIPFLVAKLTDETEVKGRVFDFWPRVHVGDVALAVLTDLFTVRDAVRTTVPGMSWDSLLERADVDTPGWALLEHFIAAHGRKGLQIKVEQTLAPYQGQLVWDKEERCFRPVGDTPPNHRVQRTRGARSLKCGALARAADAERSADIEDRGGLSEERTR